MELPKDQERLMELIGLLRDGSLGADQIKELESLLQHDPQALAYYVESVDVVTMLHRQHGVVAANQTPRLSPPIAPTVSKTDSRGWMSVLGWFAAVCASLMIGVLLGPSVMPIKGKSPNESAAAIRVIDNDEAEIATLSSAAGCRWESQEDLPFEGQRLAPRALRLVEGVAIVHFDCDVHLLLEGPAHLDLVSVDRAKLNYGKAVFKGEGDMDGFTLSTPFSEIHDEGTEYAVSVDRSGKVGEIHVFDGRVNCDPVGRLRDDAPETDAPEDSIQLDAGEARRFNGTRVVETIAVDSSRFVRKPISLEPAADAIVTVESFDYEAESLVGREGGSGWQGPWTQPSKFDQKQGASMQPSESIAWPGKKSARANGYLLIEGDTGLHRTLETPIRMDRNAAHYLSFIVRRHVATESKNQNGWAYLTLRDPRADARKVAISLTSARGTPRVFYKDRAYNATSQLRDDVSYLFVCKILTRRNKEDQISVRIYGDHEAIDSVEPSAWTITTRPMLDDSVFSELRLYSRNCEPVELDDVRIGKTWSSVASDYFQ